MNTLEINQNKKQTLNNNTTLDSLFSVFTFLLPIIFGVFTIKPKVGSPHDASRMATIQSIVEQHSLAIDKSILPLAVDIIKINGKTYSDKPPMLAIIGSGVYFILYHLFGLTFTENYQTVYYWITFVLVVIPFGLICFVLNNLFRLFGIELKKRIYLFLFSWLGTIMLPFSTTFTNHLLAAATATGALHYLIQSILPTQPLLRKTVLKLSFFSALTFTLDLPAGGLLLLAFAFIFFLNHHRVSDILWFTLGSLPPLAIHFAVNYAVTGGFLPAYLHQEYYQYPGSILASPIGKKRLFGKTILSQYWHMLFGYRGIYLFSPLLIFATVECGKALFKNQWRNQLPQLENKAINTVNLNAIRLATLLIFFGTLTAYAVQISDFGGTSYGLRWIITSIPILIFFLGLFLGRKKECRETILKIETNKIKTLKKAIPKIKSAILIFCFIWSVFISLIGLYNPWSLNIISPIPILDNIAYITLDLFPRYGQIAKSILERTSLEKGLAYYELGRFYLTRNKPAESIPYYYKSIQYDPTHALTYYHLGIALDQAGRVQEAILIYEKLLALEPNNVGALNNFGISLNKLGEYSRAEAIYRRSLALDSTRVTAHLGLAISLLGQNKIEEAEKECYLALELQPDFLPAYELLQSIKQKKKR